MENYWTRVLSGAWDKTWRPLGWDRKKAAVALLAIGGTIAALFQFGWAEMITSVTGLFWTVVPVCFAAFILFVWGVIETQAKIYKNLTQTTDETIRVLQDIIVRYQSQPSPPYDAWRHIEQMTLHYAAFYLCGMIPRSPMPMRVIQWREALEAAVRKGDLEFEPSYTQSATKELQYEYQKKNANARTKVTRDQLKTFAKKFGYDPPFLRDA